MGGGLGTVRPEAHEWYESGAVKVGADVHLYGPEKRMETSNFFWRIAVHLSFSVHLFEGTSLLSLCEGRQ